MHKKILILGGSYFVGRVFVEEILQNTEYTLYVMNRGNVPLRLRGIHEIHADRHDVDQVRKNLPDIEWDAVIDFCAYLPQDIEIMLSALDKGRIGHYLYVSTASIYAKTNDLPIKETSPKLDGPQPELGKAADYAYNKWLTELALEKQCRDRGIPHTSIRPTFIYGKYNYAPRESYFFDLIQNGKTIILPENRLALFSFVSVWDVARILGCCIGNQGVLNRAFNVAGDELISYERYVEVLEQIADQKLHIQHMNVDEINRKGIPLPFPLDEHLIYSGAGIRDVLKYEYMPFEEGMRETYKYFVKRQLK